MTIDLNKYRTVVKPAASQWLKSRPTEPVLEAISNIALSTNCPLIAVCYYVAELLGMTEEIQAFIYRLIAFYRVTAVIGQEID